jgi:hypothetical protein
MESYFLSETVKYLYLSFVDSGPLLDYYLLSTEGHLMPAFQHGSDRHLIEADLQQQQQQQQEEQRQHDEEGLEVDQGGMRGDVGDCDDSQQQQDSQAEQQQPTGSFTMTQITDDDSSRSGSNVTAAGPGGGSGSGVGTTSGSLVGKPLGSLPANCRGLCELRSAEEEAGFEARLHAALPLLPVRRVYSRRIRWADQVGRQDVDFL